MKISSKFFEVYDAIKEKFGGLIKEQYVANGERWLRFNLDKKFDLNEGIQIYFAETRDGKIKIGFDHELVNFIPRLYRVKDVFNTCNKRYQSSELKLDTKYATQLAAHLYNAII